MNSRIRAHEANMCSIEALQRGFDFDAFSAQIVDKPWRRRAARSITDLMSFYHSDVFESEVGKFMEKLEALEAYKTGVPQREAVVDETIYGKLDS